MRQVEFGILGPVEVRVDGRLLPVDGAKQRTVLAALLLSGGRVVSDDRLSELLWGRNPPVTMTAQLYTHISRLRKRCAPWLHLARRGPGYTMDHSGARFDWEDFQRLAEQGRGELADGRYADAAERLQSALALWRGPALADVTGFLEETELPRLEEARISAVEHRIEAELALGRHARSVPELTRLVAEHPLREALRGQLMTALYRCDRRADALAVYERGRRVLRDELGMDPGAGLRHVHHGVLRGDLPGPAAPEPVRVRLHKAGRAGVPGPESMSGDIWAGLVPAMLPTDIGDLSGRAEQLAVVVDGLRAPG